jgi:hypothetical protein
VFEENIVRVDPQAICIEYSNENLGAAKQSANFSYKALFAQLSIVGERGQFSRAKFVFLNIWGPILLELPSGEVVESTTSHTVTEAPVVTTPPRIHCHFIRHL